MEKALGHIVQNLGISCLKDCKRFSSAVADFLPSFEYEAERKALCACICSEVSEQIINAASNSQSEKQHILNNCVKYLTSQQKLTEQQANALVKVFTHVLWKEASSGSNASNSVAKNTATSQATVVRSTTVGNTSYTKQTTPTAKEPTWRDPTSNISTTKQTATTSSTVKTTQPKVANQSNTQIKTKEWIIFLILFGIPILMILIIDVIPSYYTEISAKSGNTRAQCALGQKYEGRELYGTAIGWYRKAVERGNSEAFNLLANLCLKRRNNSYGDYALSSTEANEVIAYLETAVNSGEKYINLAEAHKRFVRIYLSDDRELNDEELEHLEKVIECYHNATGYENEKARAWKALGHEYFNLYGLYNRCYSRYCRYDMDDKAYNSKKKSEKYASYAAKCYGEASNCGDIEATRHLGACYKDGIGVNKDIWQAVDLLKKAVEQDQDKHQAFQAKFQLAECYEKLYDYYKQKNSEEAVQYYNKAADLREAIRKEAVGSK